MSLSRETIPDLTSFFGQTPGADRVLVPWERMREWFFEVEQCSPRLTIQHLGTATLGADMDLLIISSAESIQGIEQARIRRQSLADADALAIPDNADGTLAGTKPVVLITAGIHADEVGGVQLMPELVMNLALADDPKTLTLLDQVIILIVPTLNPDGMMQVHDWYEQTLGTAAEGSDPPGLYHPYAGHDNNRDWYTHALQETRLTIDGVHRPWRPHIVLDLHQMGEHAPRYVTPPYIDPVEPHVHPRINALTTELGAIIATEQVRAGHAGASSGVMFDCYSPTRTYQHYHGGVRILAEAASAKIATPSEVAPEQVKVKRGFDPNVPSVHNPVPWPGGTWHLRDIMDYHLVTINTVLEHAATNAQTWIQDQWTMLADEVRDPSPVHYVVAPLRQQIDPPAAIELIETLQRGDVRVEYIDRGDAEVQAGSFLVRSNQPFGSYARALLDLTPYPAARPDEHGTNLAAPYDVTSHCLPLHLGVDIRRSPAMNDQPVSARPMTPGDLLVFPPPTASDIDRGRWLAIDPRSHLAISPVITALRNGAEVRRLLRPHVESGRLLPAGTWLVTDDHVFAAMSDAQQRGLRTWLVKPIPAGTAIQSLPRIALYLPWLDSAIDAGWARLALENLGIPYELVRDEDIHSGQLARYDVLLVAHSKEKALLEGNSPAVYPAPFAGGLGQEGVARLNTYLSGGGYVVALDGAASALVPALHLPIHRPLHDLKRADFSCPGSILRIMPDPSHPVTLGMDEPRPVMFADSTAFVMQWEHMGTSPARFAPDNLLVSGWMHGEEHLRGTSAIIDMTVGRGIFTGFAFRPHFRAQMLASYPMLTNALMRPGLDMSAPVQRKP